LSGVGRERGGALGKVSVVGKAVHVDKHVETDSCFVWCY